MKKWQDKGFWKSKLYYWQSLGYYYLNVIRFGSFSWFSAANIAIPFGGMLTDEKTQINGLIPDIYRSPIYKRPYDLDKLNFPVVLKPNTGLKGYKVTIVADKKTLQEIINNDDQVDWIIQDYIPFDKEYSLMYHRVPGTQNFDISSFIEKKYPYVVGDGNSTLKELIDKKTDPFLFKDEIFEINDKNLDDIIPNGELFILHQIGNYSRGAKFFSMQSEIIPSIKMAIHQCMKRIEGVDFCRLDIKADSLQDIIKGNYKVIEINGAKSEPLHIYDADIGFLESVGIINRHWKTMRKIVKVRKSQGYKFPKFKEAYAALKTLRQKVAVSS
jgi:hypothetical protein